MKKKAPEFTYFVSGQDGKDEGPFNLAEMKRRIAFGRIDGGTLVRRSDGEQWATASDFPELSIKDVVVTKFDNRGGPDALTQEMEESYYAKQVRAGAGWFFWIAAMSLFNSIHAFVSSPGGFALGLSIVYPVATAGAKIGPLGVQLALAVNVVLVAAYFLFGIFGWQKKMLPYVLGMGLYAGDTVLALVEGDIISVIIHALALFFMYRGLQALMEQRESGWSAGVWVPGSICIALVAGGGLGLNFAVKKGMLIVKANQKEQVQESWVTRPPDKWPQIVLTHDAQFRDHTPLTGSSAFLMELPDEQVVAATSSQLLGPAGGVQPKLNLNNMNQAIKSWKLHPRANHNETIAISGLFGSEKAYRTLQDWLLLELDDNDSQVKPLKLREKPLAPGETVYVVAVRYNNAQLKQEIFSGKASTPSRGVIVGAFDKPVNIEGFTGAPLVDTNGYVVGILTGTRSSADAQGRYATFSGCGVEEVARLFRTGGLE